MLKLNIICSYLIFQISDFHDLKIVNNIFFFIFDSGLQKKKLAWLCKKKKKKKKKKIRLQKQKVDFFVLFTQPLRSGRIWHKVSF